MVNSRDNLTGKRFGSLTVIKQIEDYVSPSGRHRGRWLCRCDCEKHSLVEASSNNLTSGRTTSCGCGKSYKLSKAFKRYNSYDISGAYGIGFTRDGKAFYFDIEDYATIQPYCWTIGKRGYLVSKVGEKLIPLHKLITSYEICDHKNRDKLDNRKENLREARHKDNDRNRDKMLSNTSGFIGVSWQNSKQKWRAYITVDGKWMFLGAFRNINDAVRVRLNAEKRYYGEFAPQQHLFAAYNIA